MNILVACEESQEVCKELRKRGHRAFSCDILDCSGGHPEWHIKGDVSKLINGHCEFVLQSGQTDRQTDRWDMLIAFPPCTHLAVSGATFFAKKREDGRQREGIEFFCMFLTADCDKIAIENPVGIISGDYVKKWFPDLSEKYGLPKKPSQIIQPWFWGDPAPKSTCLWLKGLPCLKPDCTEKPEFEYKEWVDKKTGQHKRQAMWFYKALHAGADRQRIRSKTFHGVAVAMATQWTDKIN